MLAWAVRAGTSTLATPDNLARWGKRVDTKCLINGCGAPSNLGHLLNGCKQSLDRFRFRHDSVLSYIIQKVVSTKQDTMKVYADLDGWRINGGSLPPDLPPSPQVPDIVLVDRTKKLVVLLELTCPFDSSAASFKAAYDRKTLRYESLALDCQGMGYETHNMPLEIGARGVITARNHTVLATLARMCQIQDLKSFRRTLGKISLVGSYRIYLARGSSEWTGGPFIKP